jgi:hypothetical protein
MVSLLNARRAEMGLSTIGFLNPQLYANGDGSDGSSGGSMFNDITSGSNNCCRDTLYGSGGNSQCCTSGFSTATGWDPVTGWGSIDFVKFAAVFGVTVPYPSTTTPVYTNPTSVRGGGGGDSLAERGFLEKFVPTMIGLVILAFLLGLYFYERFFLRKENHLTHDGYPPHFLVAYKLMRRLFSLLVNVSGTNERHISNNSSVFSCDHSQSGSSSSNNSDRVSVSSMHTTGPAEGMKHLTCTTTATTTGITEVSDGTTTRSVEQRAGSSSHIIVTDEMRILSAPYPTATDINTTAVTIATNV